MPHSNKRIHIAFSYLVVLIIVGAIYVVSCAPGALWYDGGLFQYRIWHNDIRSGLGLALAHPLYVMIGILVKHIPLGEFGYRINLLSAVAGAVTVANIFLLLRLWLGRVFPALIAALTLALSHTIWQQASISEVYSLYTALFSAEMIFLLQYFKTRYVGYLYLVGLFNGAAISIHMFAVIPLACYAVCFLTLSIMKHIKITSVLVFFLFWLVGALPYEYLIFEEIVKTGDVSSTLSSAIFGNFWKANVLNASLPPRIVLENIMLFGLNFPTPNILFFFLGVAGLRNIPADKQFVHIIFLFLFLFFVFAFRYTVPDRYTFFIPFYCLTTVFIGVGIFQFIKRYNKKAYYLLILAFLFMPLPLYYILPGLSRTMNINLGTKRVIPYLDAHMCYLSPWQTWNNGAELFAKDALTTVDEGATIIAANMTVYALNYFQEVQGMRSDVKVLSRHGDYDNPMPFPTEPKAIKQLMVDKSLYVVSPESGYCPDYLLNNFSFIRVGPLYQVKNN